MRASCKICRIDAIVRQQLISVHHFSCGEDITQLPGRISLALFEDAMNISGSFVGSCSPKTVDLFHQTRLVRIAHGTFAIWLDPFGMLDPKVLVNLLPELGKGVHLVRHGNWLAERFKCGAADRPALAQ